MKLILRRLLSLMLVLTMCGCSIAMLSSCDLKDMPSQADSNAESNTEPQEADPVITEFDLSKFEIVTPLNDTEGEKDAATMLKDSIEADYGIEISIRDVENDSPKIYEILVGRTEYVESSVVLEKLSNKDYAVEVVGKKIVIVGGTGEATEAAVEYFLDNCIKKENDMCKVSVELNYEYNYEYKYAMADVTVCSFNLRTAKKATSNVQSTREPLIADFIANYKPDSLGTQECEEFWKQRLDIVLTGYERAMSVPSGETTKNYIWYNPETLTKIDSGVFWLSETPDENSKGFGSSYYISCCWAIFEVKATGTRYVHVNTHLDTTKNAIREKEVEVLLNRVQTFLDEGYAVIMTGDYNCEINENPAKSILNAGFISSQLEAPKTSTLGTYNGVKTDTLANYNATQDIDVSKYKGPIDFIFANEFATPNEFEIIDKWPDSNTIEKFMSDHNALFAKITLYK